MLTTGTRGLEDRSALWLGNDPQVRLGGLPAVGNFSFASSSETAGTMMHVVALLPVHRRRDLVFRGELHRIDDAQDLVEVPAGAHRIDEDQLDLLVRADTNTLRTVILSAAVRPSELPSGGRIMS